MRSIYNTLACEDEAKLSEAHVFAFKGDARNYAPDVCAAGGLRLLDSKSGDLMIIAFPFEEASRGRLAKSRIYK